MFTSQIYFHVFIYSRSPYRCCCEVNHLKCRLEFSICCYIFIDHELCLTRFTVNPSVTAGLLLPSVQFLHLEVTRQNLTFTRQVSVCLNAFTIQTVGFTFYQAMLESSTKLLVLQIEAGANFLEARLVHPSFEHSSVGLKSDCFPRRAVNFILPPATKFSLPRLRNSIAQTVTLNSSSSIYTRFTPHTVCNLFLYPWNSFEFDFPTTETLRHPHAVLQQIYNRRFGGCCGND